MAEWGGRASVIVIKRTKKMYKALSVMYTSEKLRVCRILKNKTKQYKKYRPYKYNNMCVCV